MSLIVETPDAPWLRRTDWAAKKCDGLEKRQAVGAWIGPILFAIPTALLGFLGLWGLFDGIYFIAVFALPLDAVEGFLIWFALREMKRLHTYGNPVLSIVKIPVALGGAFRGEISFGQRMPSNRSFTLNLRCVSQWQNGQSLDRVVLWQNEQVVALTPDGRLPVSFLTPRDGKETTVLRIGGGTYWLLRVSASSGTIPFRDEYQIPVFKVPLGAEDELDAKAADSEHRAKVDEYHLTSDSHIHINTLATGQTEFFFEANRAPGVAVPLTIGALGLWLMSFLTTLPAGDSCIHPSALWTPLLFCGGLILTYAACRTFFGTKRVTIDFGQMVIKDVLGFIPVGTTTIPARDVISIKAQTQITTSRGTVYNRLLVECQDGKAIAGSLISDAREAEWLAAQMSQRLGK